MINVVPVGPTGDFCLNMANKCPDLNAFCGTAYTVA